MAKKIKYLPLLFWHLYPSKPVHFPYELIANKLIFVCKVQCCPYKEFCYWDAKVKYVDLKDTLSAKCKIQFVVLNIKNCLLHRMSEKDSANLICNWQYDKWL